MTLRVISSGVDSLYASAKGKLWDGLPSVLRNMRELNPDQEIVFDLHAEAGSYLLRPHGWRGYPFWISSPTHEFYLGASHPFPPLYVVLRSWYLHTLGADLAVVDTEELLRREFFPQGFVLMPSRVDVYADVQGWAPTHADFQHFVCRGVRRRMFDVPREAHGFGTQLSGFAFGKGEVVARIYNKTLELASRGETWPHLFWRDADPDYPVWRVEFQYRREALIALGIGTMDAVLSHRQSLWKYGTEKWLSLRTPNGGSNRWRWPEHPAWVQLREAEIGMPASELVRGRVRQANERRLVSGAVGYTTALAALWSEHDMSAAMRRLVLAEGRYLSDRGVTSSDVVQRKRAHRQAKSA
jgi:hypothetical protein